MSLLISSLFIFQKKCKSIFVCKLFVRCANLLLLLQFKVFLFMIWVNFEKLVVINYFVVSKKMFCLINRCRRRNNWSLKILLKNNWKRLKNWQRDEIRNRTLTRILIVINWSMIFNDQKTIINWKRDVYCRMNLAFTLIILIINLTITSEVHIFLLLHNS